MIGMLEDKQRKSITMHGNRITANILLCKERGIIAEVACLGVLVLVRGG